VNLLLGQILNGIATGMLYALMGLGLSLITGVLNIPNFAHGALFAIGAYFLVSVVGVLGNFWLGLLVADYAFGWSVEKYIKEVGKTHGLEFVGADRHPLGEREFSNYVQKAAANRPDVVAMINFGGDAVAGAREIFNFGLTPKIPLIMSWSSGVEELIQLAPEIRENCWVGSNFYYTADTPAARNFVKSYQAKFGTPPGYAPSAAYSMTRMLLAGFDKAGSAEVQDVIKALEGIEVNDLLGRMRVDPATHQTLRPYFFLRCKTKAQMKEELDLATVIATGDAPLPKEYAACKDIGSF